ncbi:MAG: tetratricopeptide repeat protein [Cyanobacteria bacterium TGS_CYA1]|nr:tetratricopeptide repeat protein [Cyanobacteria bacterium TGS_CYA1]
MKIHTKKALYFLLFVLLWNSPQIQAAEAENKSEQKTEVDNSKLKDWEKSRNEAFLEIYKNGNILRGIEKLEQSISEAKKSNAASQDILKLYRLYLSYCGRVKNFDLALNAYQGIIEYAEKTGNIEMRDGYLITLAYLEFDLHHYEKTVEYAQKALQSAAKTRGEHFPGLIRGYELVGSAQLKLKNLALAKENFKKSLEISNSTFALHYQGSVGLDYWGLGLIAEEEGDKKLALEYFQKAKEKSDEIIHRSSVITKANGINESLKNDQYLTRVSDELSGVERDFIYKDIDKDIERVKSPSTPKE